MTPRLEQHIKKELYTKRVFTIPGIGSFHLKREAATFSEDKFTLYPPNYHVQFSDDLSSAIDAQYKDELLLLSERILNEINTNGKSKIRGLGVFQKENTKFNFYPDKDLEKAFSLGLEPVYNVKEVAKSYSGTPSIKAATLVVTKPKKDYTSLIKMAKIAGWIILGLGLLYALLNIPITLSDNNTPVIKEIKVTKPTDSVAKIDTPMYVSTPQTGDSADTGIENSNALNNPQDDIDKKTVEKETVEKPAVPKLEQPKAKAQQSIASTKRAQKPVKIILPKTKVDTNEISPITGKACAVITGSFKTSIYALKMVKKLQKLGYKVYTEEKVGSTRVGLLFDCTKTNADSLLREIRSSIDTTSWILE